MNRTSTDLFGSSASNYSSEETKVMKNYNVNPVRSLITGAKNALIVVPQISIDAIAAALALALSLKKQNIDTRVYCPQKTDNNYSRLSGLELLIDSVSSGDLIVSLNYPLDNIDAVSYNNDNDRLNLVVKTKQNSPKIEENCITINNQSTPADLCFMFGDESTLGQNASLVNKGNWIFISPVSVAKNWAKASIIDPDAPFCEIFTFLLPMLGLNLDLDSGKNLLIGLRVATQSFSVNVSPETFEAGAVCLRATQPLDNQPLPNSPPIENIEKSGNLIPGTNKPNPNPTI